MTLERYEKPKIEILLFDEVEMLTESQNGTDNIGAVVYHDDLLIDIGLDMPKFTIKESTQEQQ